MEIQLNEQQQSLLAFMAQNAGMKLDTFVHSIIEEKIGSQASQKSLTGNAWKQKLESVVARHAPTGRPVDDTRDSIYPDHD